MSRGGSNPSFSVSYSTIAQLVERLTVNQNVTGSSPIGGVQQYGVHLETSLGVR